MTKFFDQNFQFCPRCGAPGGAATSQQPHQKRCERCGFVYYYDPNPAVACVIFQDQQILLGKRKFAPFAGLLDTVGGFVEVGESAEEAVIRECFEETHLQVKVLRYLDSFADEYGAAGQATLNLYFEVEPVSGKMQAADDMAELAYYPITKIQTEQLAFANARQFMSCLQKGKYV